MSSDFAIKVENLSKCYHIYDKPHDRLFQMLTKGRSKRYREFWALQDVSLEVKRGETIGIVGRNGSGKSTLLQLICGTLNPTSGTIQTTGRIAALLELGSGFNPEFTGRENVYLNASVLGLAKREIDERFDQIAAFADVGDFIDQPIKTYSSGMVIRLAFAISASIEPEILIIDEALAVGDIRFQAKCFNRLAKLKEAGTTILLVSHATDQIVKHCNQAVLIEKGRVLSIGPPKNITNKYMDLLYGRPGPKDPVNIDKGPALDGGYAKHLSATAFAFSDVKEDVFSQTLGWNPNEYRWGNGDACILDFRILDPAGKHTVQLYADEQYSIVMKVLLKRPVPDAVFGFYIKTIDGLQITGSNSHDFPKELQINKDPGTRDGMFEVSFNFQPRLASGEYMISLGVAEDVDGELAPLDRRYDSVLAHVINRKPHFGMVDFDSRCLVRELAYEQGGVHGR